jgi:hypothetical protein
MQSGSCRLSEGQGGQARVPQPEKQRCHRKSVLINCNELYLGMRLISVLLLTGLILVAGCTGIGETPVPGTGQPVTGAKNSTLKGAAWTMYADELSGFRMQYPTEWDYALADVVDPQKNLISTNVYFKPYTADDIVLSISARNGSLSANRSIETQVADEIASLNASGLPFTIVERSNLTISTYPAAKLVYRVEDQGIPYLTGYVFIDAGSHRYILYSRLADNQTSRYKPSVDQAIASFRITG